MYYVHLFSILFGTTILICFFLILALKPPIGFWGSKFDMTHYVTKFLVFVQHVFGFLFCICVLRFLLSQLPESVANLELAIAGLATAPLG